MAALAAWALRVPPLAARIVARRRAIAVAAALLFVAGGVVTRGYPRESAPTQTLGYTALGLTALALLVVAVLVQARGGRAAALLAPGALRSVGKYSYAMYIFHVPIHHQLGVPLLARLGYTHPGVGVTLVYAVAMSIVTYGAALISFHVLEKRFLQLKRRFPVARAGTAP